MNLNKIEFKYMLHYPFLFSYFQTLVIQIPWHLKLFSSLRTPLNIKLFSSENSNSFSCYPMMNKNGDQPLCIVKTITMHSFDAIDSAILKGKVKSLTIFIQVKLLEENSFLKTKPFRSLWINQCKISKLCSWHGFLCLR